MKRTPEQLAKLVARAEKRLAFIRLKGEPEKRKPARRYAQTKPTPEQVAEALRLAEIREARRVEAIEREQARNTEKVRKREQLAERIRLNAIKRKLKRSEAMKRARARIPAAIERARVKAAKALKREQVEADKAARIKKREQAEAAKVLKREQVEADKAARIKKREQAEAAKVLKREQRAETTRVNAIKRDLKRREDAKQARLDKLTPEERQQKALVAETRANRWLADGNAASEAGKKDKAEKCYALSQFWLDRYNSFAGNN